MLVPNIFLVVGMAILTLAIVHTLKCTFSGSEWDDPMILRGGVSTSRMVVNKDTHEHTYFLVSMILSVIQILSVLLITCASGLSLINIYRDAGVDCGLRRRLACGHALALLGTGGAFAFAVYGVVRTNHGHPVLSDFEGARRDFCGVCAGENNTCAACDGAVAGATVVDDCGVCAGDGSVCSHTVPPLPLSCACSESSECVRYGAWGYGCLGLLLLTRLIGRHNKQEPQ